MNPCTDEDAFLGECLGTLRVLVLTRDGQVLTLVASECARQSCSVVVVLCCCILLDTVEVLHQV